MTGWDLSDGSLAKMRSCQSYGSVEPCVVRRGDRGVDLNRLQTCYPAMTNVIAFAGDGIRQLLVIRCLNSTYMDAVDSYSVDAWYRVSTINNIQKAFLDDCAYIIRRVLPGILAHGQKTQLSLAVRKGFIENHHPNIDAFLMSSIGDTTAVFGESIERIRELSLLHSAGQRIRPGNGRIRYLLDHGVSVDGHALTNKAIEAGNVELVDHLLFRGVDIKKCGKAGSTCIARAFFAGSGRNDFTIFRKLVDHGVDLDIIYDNGSSLRGTILQVAISCGKVEPVDYLITRGADLDNTDGVGQTALIQLIVEAGIIATAIKEDATWTYEIVIGLIKRLLNLGAKLTNAFHVVNHPEVLGILIDHVKEKRQAVLIDAENGDGMTPLASIVRAYVRSKATGELKRSSMLAECGYLLMMNGARKLVHDETTSRYPEFMFVKSAFA